MASIFSEIIAGRLPGRFVWRDDRAVAFLTIHPMSRGHSLVVPRDEVDHWIDLPPGLGAHLFEVAQAVGRGLDRAFRPKRVAVMVAGLEVPHTHVHVFGIERMADLDLKNQDLSPDPAALDEAAASLRNALRQLGYAAASE